MGEFIPLTLNYLMEFGWVKILTNDVCVAKVFPTRILRYMAHARIHLHIYACMHIDAYI